MKKIDLGAAIAVLANLGVIAGIVVLAIELQQNTDLLRTEMRFSQNERVTEVVEEFFRNAPLTGAYLKFANEQPISPQEDLMLSTVVQRILISWNWIHGEVQRGSMEQTAMRNFRRLFYAYPAGGMETPFISHYWPYFVDSMSPEFRQWMEDNVIAPGAPE